MDQNPISTLTKRSNPQKAGMIQGKWQYPNFQSDFGWDVSIPIVSWKYSALKLDSPDPLRIDISFEAVTSDVCERKCGICDATYNSVIVSEISLLCPFLKAEYSQRALHLLLNFTSQPRTWSLFLRTAQCCKLELIYSRSAQESLGLDLPIVYIFSVNFFRSTESISRLALKSS